MFFSMPNRQIKKQLELTGKKGGVRNEYAERCKIFVYDDLRVK